MRYLTASIFLLAFFVHTFSKGFLAVHYLLYTDVYLKACVNKEKPELGCNGKCQLGKKMTEQENASTPVPILKDAGKTEVLSTRSYPPVYKTVLQFKVIVRIPVHDAGAAVHRSFSVFHPPRYRYLA